MNRIVLRHGIPARVFLVFFVSVGLGIGLAGEQTAPIVPGEADAATNSVEMTLRDPFWPVGYRKPDPETNMPPQGPATSVSEEVVWPTLHVVAISKTPQNQWVAMLKDIGLVQVGDWVRVRKGDRIFRWKITAIGEKGIRYQKLEILPIQTTTNMVGKP